MRNAYHILMSIGILLSAQVVTKTFAQVPLVFEVENREPTGTCNTAAGNTNTSIASMPDPFEFTTGGRVATFEDWTCRRNQIKSDIEQYEIGTKPPKPSSVTATYSGGVLSVVCTHNGQTLTLTSNVTMPSGTGPFPVVIGMNSPTGSLGANLFNGVIQIPFNHNQVTTYNGKSNNDPFFRLYPNLTANGQYSAWSWGISRLIDGIEIVKAQMNADTKRIAVTGCSYAGKMALFGGAFDERIALTIAQESGGGGINSWRMSQAYVDRGNEDIEKINNTNGSWFKNSMRSLNPLTLPHDHHELIAMIAPRAFLAFGNPPYGWLGDESGYKASMAALEVWKAMGVEDRFGFDFAGGHSHCEAAGSQNTAATAFINKFLKNTTANTNVRLAPNQSGFNLTINSSVYNWTTPTITFEPENPNAPEVTITAPTTESSLEVNESINITTTVTDADNNVTKVEFFAGTVKIGEDATAPYTFGWTPTTTGTFSLTAVVTDAATNTGTSAAISIRVIPPPLEIMKTPTAIVIDGEADEIWNNASIGSIEALNEIVGSVSDDADLSGSAKFLWDDTYFYVFATITDDAKQNDSPNSYEDDAVEIYLDINNDKASTYGANDVQYTFGWDDGTTVGALPAGRATTGITYSAVSTTDGYIIEASIPWATVQGAPAVNQMIGIDFMINDDDDGAERDSKLSWSATTDDAWQNPSLFGVAKLVSEPLITGTASFITSDVSYYPNPFTSGLKIEAPENTTYQLISIDGRIMEEGNVTNEKQIGNHLAQGSYLLRWNKGDEVITKMVVKN